MPSSPLMTHYKTIFVHPVRAGPHRNLQECTLFSFFDLQVLLSLQKSVSNISLFLKELPQRPSLTHLLHPSDSVPPLPQHPQNTKRKDLHFRSKDQNTDLTVEKRFLERRNYAVIRLMNKDRSRRFISPTSETTSSVRMNE